MRARRVFEEAHGGTLFIDEIGDLALALQAKLLRVLDRGELRRVGAQETTKVDVRVLSATRRDLDKEVAARPRRR
jgi:transcriptional regulator with GAF, ATPase, and Fis domain